MSPTSFEKAAPVWWPGRGVRSGRGRAVPDGFEVVTLRVYMSAAAAPRAEDQSVVAIEGAHPACYPEARCPQHRTKLILFPPRVASLPNGEKT